MTRKTRIVSAALAAPSLLAAVPAVGQAHYAEHRARCDRWLLDPAGTVIEHTLFG